MNDIIPSDPIKPWWQSKLIWVGVLQVVLASLQLSQNVDWSDPMAWTLFGTGLVTIVLRWLTDEPVTSLITGMDRFRPRVRSNTKASKRRGEKPTNHRLKNGG
jgi:hypothetical protein